MPVSKTTQNAPRSGRAIATAVLQIGRALRCPAERLATMRLARPTNAHSLDARKNSRCLQDTHHPPNGQTAVNAPNETTPTLLPHRGHGQKASPYEIAAQRKKRTQAAVRSGSRIATADASNRAQHARLTRRYCFHARFFAFIGGQRCWDARCARRNTIPRSCLRVLRAYRLARRSFAPLRDPLPPREESGRGSLSAPRTPLPCAAAARSGRSRRRRSRRRRDGRRRRARGAPDAGGRPCRLPPERSASARFCRR